MFNSTDRRLYMDQKTYKEQYDRHVTRPKKFAVGDYVFVNVPPTEAKTGQQRQQNEAKSKLLPRTHGPFEVMQVFENVIVVLEGTEWVPTSIDRCTLAPPPRKVPNDPNTPVQDDEQRFAQSTNDLSDNAVRNTYHEDAVQPSSGDEIIPHFIRIVDHVSHQDGRVT